MATDPIELVKLRANERSAELIETRGGASLLFSRKPKLWDYVATQVPKTGLMMECGVWKGTSINHFAKRFPDRTLYGFDSFEGLSEAWAGMYHQAGHFDLKGQLPEVEPNVVLTKGWVDDTLPPFFKENKDKIAYLHVDTDTYSPASTILKLAKSRLVPGSIVQFDELIGYPHWEKGEYQALVEEFPDGSYEYIAFSNMQAAIRITGSLS